MAVPAPAQSQPSSQGGWQFELTPYVWLAGMSDDIGSGAPTFHVCGPGRPNPPMKGVRFLQSGEADVIFQKFGLE